MWFFQKLRSAKAQHDDQQQHHDSQLQSDSPADNDKQVQVLAQDLKNLVFSSKDEVIDRFIQGQSVITNGEDQVKQVVDEDHRNVVVKEVVNEASQASSSSQNEAKNHCVKNALVVDTKECRVSEEREAGERCEIQDNDKLSEHKDGVLKEKHEIEIKDRDVKGTIRSYENTGGDGWEEGSVTVSDDGKLKSKAYYYSLRPDCSHYTRTGMCKFGSNCRFNHPHIGEIQPVKETKKKKEENVERHEPIESKQPVKETKKTMEENVHMHGSNEFKPSRRSRKKKEENVEKHGPNECKSNIETKMKKEENTEIYGPPECKQPMKDTKKKKDENVQRHGPIECKQPVVEIKKKNQENIERHAPIECKLTKETKNKKVENVEKHGPIESKHTKETKMKKEENTKRHEPVECKPMKDTKKKKEENAERHGSIEYKHPIKETKKKMEENSERHRQIECKDHMSSAGCKYGKACKFNHGKGKNVKTPVVEYNFVGLPIRPGEKECPYYMRNGFCQHGRNCRLHHPDPTAVESNDEPQPNIPNTPSWSAPRTLDPTASSFVPMMYSSPQNMPPPNPDWYGFQAPAYIYQGPHIPPPFFPNNPPSDTNMMYTHQQQPVLVSKSTERPGPPNCRYFMKTGNCKNGASCKFSHSQSQTTRTTKDQIICNHFSKHGTCKFGSACKYDHPVNSSNSIPAGEGNDGSNGPDH